jgi:uncharacterized protein YjbI with pentapeptide repeats
MRLLIVPLTLAITAYLFNLAQYRTELKIASERQQEETLQGYLDKMTDLLLEENLRNSDYEAEVRSVARARTLTVLHTLDVERKATILRFLYETKLISGLLSVINLGNADLSGSVLDEAYLLGANLYAANLRGAYLRGAILSEANLERTHLSDAKLYKALASKINLSAAILKNANLTEIILNEADLTSADLTNADLTNADLTKANLKGAKVTGQQLAQAKSLKGAIMPDGTVHE